MAEKIGKMLVVLLSLALVAILAMVGFLWGYRYVRSQDQRLGRLRELAEARGGALVSEEDPQAIPVHIPRSADMAAISDILLANRLIGNKAIFKIISKFNGFDGHYQAGTHYLLSGMSYDEIMFVLTRQPKPLQITFPEGMTYRQIKQSLKEAGLNLDDRRMDELVRHPNAFLDYSFVRQLQAQSQREWMLQGYLWPDTYRFDPNMDEESVLRMFLDNTEAKLKENDYLGRAAMIGLSLDDAISLASIVQKEGEITEMSKIGRVFLNRLSQGMPLESCATINYLRSEEDKEPTFWASAADLARYRSSPYNSYGHVGLPPGPINNPGTIAIEGVLWPANEDSWPGASAYLYFCATGEGNNVFAVTLEEHEANVDHYSQIWRAEEGATTETEEETGGN